MPEPLRLDRMTGRATDCVANCVTDFINRPVRLRLAFIVCLLGTCLISSIFAQTNVPQPDPRAIPSIEGGIGPCTADFTVTDASGKPVYAAKVKVHIAYGFMNVRKLDLEVGTNVEGKARFTGLPDHIKHGVYFYASEGNRAGEVFDDPANTCKAQFTVTLREKIQ